MKTLRLLFARLGLELFFLSLSIGLLVLCFVLLAGWQEAKLWLQIAGMIAGFLGLIIASYNLVVRIMDTHWGDLRD